MRDMGRYGLISIGVNTKYTPKLERILEIVNAVYEPEMCKICVLCVQIYKKVFLCVVQSVWMLVMV